jgi:hypothetical protein
MATVVDQTQVFTIQQIEAQAEIVQIWVLCTQPDGTQQGFIVYPDGQVPQCAPGVGNIYFGSGAIGIRNIGASGTIFIRVVDDAGVELHYEEFTANTGDLRGNIAFAVDMPNRDYTITIEAGHL